MQDIVVALIVVACTGYAVWVLMPGALRRGVAQRALVLPWPGAVKARLQRAAKVSGGCACDGCDAKVKPAASASQPIRIHRHPKH